MAMEAPDPASARNRAVGLAAAAFVQLLLGYVLIYGLPRGDGAIVARALQAFAVPAPTPAPPPKLIPPRIVAASKPHASPAAAFVRPSAALPALAAAAPLTTLPSPVVAAIDVPALGSAAAGSGSVEGSVEGSGGGAGGSGNGNGSGDDGIGDGGVTPAQQVKGRLTRRDFPSALYRRGATVTLSSQFVVGTDGRVESCTITRSSGDADLDALVCRLIGERFVYRPARDGHGRPIREIETRDHYLTLG